jgi:RimJ/RimL family protein N-acetyltransferase
MYIKYGCAILRAIEEKDFDLLFFMINDPDIENQTGGWHLPVSSSEQKQWIATYRNTDNNIRLMVELSNGKTIGMVSLTDIDWKNRTAEINYKIHVSPEDRIKNDIFNGTLALLNYAFNELGLNCVYVRIIASNISSLKLQDKLGFKKEGEIRERIYKNGKFHNQIVASLLKSEFGEIYKDA